MNKSIYHKYANSTRHIKKTVFASFLLLILLFHSLFNQQTDLIGLVRIEWWSCAVIFSFSKRNGFGIEYFCGWLMAWDWLLMMNFCFNKDDCWIYFWVDLVIWLSYLFDPQKMCWVVKLFFGTSFRFNCLVVLVVLRTFCCNDWEIDLCWKLDPRTHKSNTYWFPIYSLSKRSQRPYTGIAFRPYLNRGSRFK